MVCKHAQTWEWGGVGERGLTPPCRTKRCLYRTPPYIPDLTRWGRRGHGTFYEHVAKSSWFISSTYSHRVPGCCIQWPDFMKRYRGSLGRSGSLSRDQFLPHLVGVYHCLSKEWAALRKRLEAYKVRLFPRIMVLNTTTAWNTFL